MRGKVTHIEESLFRLIQVIHTTKEYKKTQWAFKDIKIIDDRQ